MAEIIDDRVVRLDFDNSSFEKNVGTSIHSIEKLKQSISSKWSSNAIDDIAKSSKNVTFDPLARSVDTVRVKFSMLQFAAMRVMGNIVDKAQATATRLVKAFTIDPPKSGLQEYETQIGAVQTILANTSNKGTTLDEVNQALDTLNKYADKTIYNFTQMTRNIGTFTAAGVDLKTSVQAIQGIANLAAVSGSTSQQASTAMYQLSQALAAGSVKLQDWNSVVNAGMGGEVFQQALIRTSNVLKTGADEAIKKYGTFRESLTKGNWLTTEVLTETLGQFAGAYSEAELISKGYSEKQAAEITKMAQTAEDAATKVKTYTQLLDTLGEAVQSGWTQTWELIIGDFEEAKELWSGTSDVLNGLIESYSDARNNMLEEALTSNYKKFQKELAECGVSADQFYSALESSMAELQDGKKLDAVVKRFGSLEKAFQANAISSQVLDKALQKLQNGGGSSLDKLEDIMNPETMTRVQKALMAAGYELGKFGADGLWGSETRNAIMAFQKDKGLSVDGIIGPQTIAALKELPAASGEVQKFTDKLWDLVPVLDDIGGRQVILNGFANIWTGLSGIGKQIAESWSATGLGMKSETLSSLINSFYAMSENFLFTDETLGNLRIGFDGFFKLLGTGKDLFTGAFSLALNSITNSFGHFNVDISKGVAGVGEMFSKFSDWVNELHLVETMGPKFTSGITSGFEQVTAFIKKTDTYKDFTSFAGRVSDAFETSFTMDGSFSDRLATFWSYIETMSSDNKFAEFAKNIKSLGEEIGTFVEGLGVKETVVGFFETVSKAIEAASNADVESFTEKIKTFFDSLAENAGNNRLVNSLLSIIEFIDAMRLAATDIPGFLTDMGTSIQEFFTNLINNKGEINLESIGTVITDFIDQMTKAFKDNTVGRFEKAKVAIQNAINSLLLVFFKTQERVDSVKKWLSDMFNKGGLSPAIGFGLLYATWNKFGKGMTAIFTNITKIADKFADVGKALAEGLKGFSKYYDQLGRAAVINAKTAKLKQTGKTLFTIAAAVAVLAVAAYMLSKVPRDDLIRAGETLAAFALGLIIFSGAMKLLKLDESLGKNVRELAGAIAILALAMWVLSKTDFGVNGDIGCLVMLAALAATVVAMALVFTKLELFNKKTSKNAPIAFLAMVGSVLLMVLALAGLAEVNKRYGWKTVALSLLELGVVLGVLVGLGWIMAKTNFGWSQGAGLLLMVLSITKLISALKKIAKFDPKIVTNNLKSFITVFAVMATLALMSKLAGPNMFQMGAGLILIGIAINILLGVIKKLAKLDPADAMTGAFALAEILAALALFMFLLKFVDSGKTGLAKYAATMLIMSISIGILAGIVLLLAAMPQDRITSATNNVVKLMALMAGMLYTLKFMQVGMGTVAVIAAMTLAIAALVAIAYELSLIEDPSKMDNAIGMIAKLVAIFAGLAAAMKIFVSGNFKTMLSQSLGLAVITGVIAALGYIVYQLGTSMTPEQAETALVAMKAIRKVMFGVSVLAKAGSAFQGAGFGGGAGAAFGLLGFISVIGVVIAIMGVLQALVDKYANSAIKEALGAVWTGIEEILGALGHLVGVVIREFVQGLFGIDDDFSMLEQVGGMIETLEGVVTMAQDFPEADFTNIKDAIAAFMLIEFTALFDKVVSWVIGESSLSKFGENAKSLGEAIVSFSEACAKVSSDDAAHIKDVVAAIEEINKLKDTVEKTGGLAQVFGGWKDLGQFSENLIWFAMGIEAYAWAAHFMPDDAIEKMKQVTEASKELGGLQEAVGDNSGLLPKIVGWTDIGKFGENLAQYGRCLFGFANSIRSLKSSDLTQIATVTELSKGISEFANSIDTSQSSGWMTIFQGGDFSMKTFGESLSTFGGALVDFCQKVQGQLDPNVLVPIDLMFAQLYVICLAIKSADMINSITDAIYVIGGLQGGLEAFQGATDGQDFNRIIEAAQAVRQMINILSDQTTKSADLSTYAVTLLSGLGTQLTSNKEIIQNALVGVVKDALAYATDLSNITPENNAFNTTVDVFTNKDRGAKKFQEQVDAASSSGEGAGAALAEGARSQIDNVSQAGADLMNALATGASGAHERVTSIFRASVRVAAYAAKSEVSAFTDAGMYLVLGLANGISAYASEAAHAAAKVAQAAKDAANATLRVGSPSKELYETGMWFDIGFANGIGENGKAAVDNAHNLAYNAYDAMRNTIATFTSMLDTDLEAITPTITPTVNLDNVYASADLMRSLMTFNTSSGVLANISAIDSSIRASRNQNDTNNIVSAIKALGANMDNKPSTTYNFGGITYGSDDAVGQALGTLVQALQMHNRM